MNQYTLTMLLVVAPLRVMAQRLDGCPTPETPTSTTSTLSPGAVADRLKQLGVGTGAHELAIGLTSPRPDLRSLSALKLAESADSDNLALLMKAWLAEQDECTKGLTRHAVTMFVRSLSHDPTQRPDGQLWVKPFLPCSPPAAPRVTLRLEEVSRPGITVPAVQVVARNETQETIPFVVGARSPLELFSATVTGPSGEHTEVPARLEVMYRPLRSTDGVFTAHSRIFVPLPPGEDVSLWTWTVGDDFNMSEPGTYRVSLGGRFAYLDTTVCSNTLEVNVGQ
jgi:hypothetical protein